MTLTEIFEQIRKLTPDEKRQLRDVLIRELASEREPEENPEFCRVAIRLSAPLDLANFRA